MFQAAPEPELARRKHVRLRARPNLHISTRLQGGRRVYLVKDPVSLQYFHLEEPQGFLLRSMDGQKTLEDLRQVFEQEYVPQQLSLEDLESFASQLVQSGLVENPALAAGASLYDRRERQRKAERRGWLNLFYIKIPLVDPNIWLNRVLPVGAVVFHPLFLLAALIALLSAGALVVTRWGQFWDQVPTYQEFFLGRHLLLLWLALGLVKILHELGHALCSKLVGGDVHEMGVVFLFFFPTLYCNVTDSCTLVEKWKRIAVAAAGIYIELLIATVAVFSWWFTAPSSFWNNLSFDLILVCAVHTLVFNANPLMRFDGYFMLSDLVEIPNLAQASSRRVLTLGLSWLGLPVTKGADDDRPLLVVYGIASLVYRQFVSITVVWLCYLILREYHLPWLGVALLMFAAALLLGVPILRLVRAYRKRGRLPPMKSSRVLLTVGALGAAIAVFVFVPLPQWVRGQAILQVTPQQQHRLTIPAPGGYLEQVFAKDGQAVREGDILAILVNPELEQKLTLNALEQGLRQQQRHVLVAQMAADIRVALGSESHEEVEHYLTMLTHEQQALKMQKERLVLRAPRDGMVLDVPSWEAHGKWFSEGDPYCVVGAAASIRALMVVDPADRALVQEGATASFLSHNSGRLWQAEVADVGRVDEASIPPQLSGRLGGEVATRQDPYTKAEQPFQQHFLVAARLTQPDETLQVGALGRVRIDAGRSTLWWRLQRWLGTTMALRVP